jgi:hypothetical protein
VAAIAPDMNWDLPLRILGGLHYLVLGGEASWDDVDAAVDAHAEFLAHFVREQPVQTNEVARAWALLPGLLSVGTERVDLLELGASGGLLLFLDRYGFRYDGDGGAPAGLFERPLEIVRRRGVDTHPVDVTTDEGARLLQAFVWADQPERLERLREAIAIVREDPPELITGDYVELLPELLADRCDDATTVVMSAVTTMYLEDDRFDQLVNELRGVVWLSLEGPRGDLEYEGARLELNGRVLAEHVDYHGTSMQWIA